MMETHLLTNVETQMKFRNKWKQKLILVQAMSVSVIGVKCDTFIFSCACKALWHWTLWTLWFIEILV